VTGQADPDLAPRRVTSRRPEDAAPLVTGEAGAGLAPVADLVELETDQAPTGRADAAPQTDRIGLGTDLPDAARRLDTDPAPGTELAGAGPDLRHAADGVDPGLAPVAELVEVMRILRRDCPWDAEQTHRSLVPYLIEETAEVVEAIETGDDAALREELGDLLFEIVFHAHLGAERGAFSLGDLAADVAAKLIARHPYVFAGDAVPDDLMISWERRKKREKRRASAVDGLPEPLHTLARATKVVTRARSCGVPVALPDEPIGGTDLGAQLLALVARGQAAGVDADQALRAALRQLEDEVRALEETSAAGPAHEAAGDGPA